MNKELNKALGAMTEAEFHEVRDRLEKATWIRNIEQGFNMSTDEVAKAIRVNPTELELLRSGAVDFSGEITGKIRAFDLEERLRRMRDQKKAQETALRKLVAEQREKPEYREDKPKLDIVKAEA